MRSGYSDCSDSEEEINVIFQDDDDLYEHSPGTLPSSSQSEWHAKWMPDDQNFLMAMDWTTKELDYEKLEEKAFNEYKFVDPMREYRGGKWQTSCCYLFLDPQVTRDLHRSRSQLSDEERWKRFIDGIFYVGQGKASRPEEHFRCANDMRSKGNYVEPPSCMILKILDIWNSGRGVICLQVFSRTMAEEACCREAAMIDALNPNRLTNCKRGTYYGPAKTMSDDEKRSLGKYLLYKAMEILILDGEREIFPRTSNSS